MESLILEGVQLHDRGSHCVMTSVEMLCITSEGALKMGQWLIEYAASQGVFPAATLQIDEGQVPQQVTLQVDERLVWLLSRCARISQVGWGDASEVADSSVKEFNERFGKERNNA